MAENLFDFNKDKPDMRLPIPAGVPLMLRLNYVPGGKGPNGALTGGKPPSDAEYLKTEFTVLRGPYKGRKFWSNMTFSGGKLDERGRSIAGDITRKNIRAIIDSSSGLAVSDESPEAQAKRVLPNGFADLQGRQFVALSKIEPAKDGYEARNGLGVILTIDHPKWPKSEAKLDNPSVPGTASAAPTVPGVGTVAAPSWGAPAAVAPAAPTPTYDPSTADASPPAAMIAAAAPPSNGALPAWMQQ